MRAKLWQRAPPRLGLVLRRPPSAGHPCGVVLELPDLDRVFKVRTRVMGVQGAAAAMPHSAGANSASRVLFRHLARLRPGYYLAVEAVGRQAMLQALKAIANSGPLSAPTRFTPLLFEEPPPSPPASLQLDDVSTENGGDAAAEGPLDSRRRHSRPVRGIRFFLAHASAAPDAPPRGPALADVAPTRVTATTCVKGLAHAVSTERRMRSGSTPVILEALCTARHALVLCQALVHAQLLASSTGDLARRFNCTACVTYVPWDAHSGLRLREGGARADAPPTAPRLLRIFVWGAGVHD